MQKPGEMGEDSSRDLPPEMWIFANPPWFCFAEEVSEEEMSEEEERENGNHIPVGTMQILNVLKKCLPEFLQLDKSISANI